MAQKKAYEVQGWLAKPDQRFSVVLLYGPDRGMVSERARDFAIKTGIALDDPFSVVRLEADEADQQGRLRDEALTVPMFATRRLLWVRNISAHKNLAEDVRFLVAQPSADATLLLEAGELKKAAALRTIVEGSANAIALPCYPDEARDLDRLIDEVLGQANLRVGLDARTALKRNLGGDRMATRGELEKLALYAAGTSEITLADVDALTGDVSDQSLDDVVDAILEGRLSAFDTAMQRFVGSGGQPFLLINGMMRQLQALQIMRAAFDGGRSAAEIIASARPPVFFARKKLVENALRRLTAQTIERGLSRLYSALLETRRRPDLTIALTRQALLGIAVESARLAA